MDFLKFDAVKCTLCGKCIDKCPFGALRILTQVTLKLLPAADLLAHARHAV